MSRLLRDPSRLLIHLQHRLEHRSIDATRVRYAWWGSKYVYENGRTVIDDIHHAVYQAIPFGLDHSAGTNLHSTFLPLLTSLGIQRSQTLSIAVSRAPSSCRNQPHRASRRLCRGDPTLPLHGTLSRAFSSLTSISKPMFHSAEKSIVHQPRRGASYPVPICVSLESRFFQIS